MKIRKAVKAMVAVGTGLTMLGATMFSATAASLSTYPAPFVSSGKFTGSIVVGEKAATSDVLGAIDIAAAIQAAATTAVAGSSTTTTTTAVSAGAHLKGASQLLALGGAMNASKQTITKSELPTALADGEVDEDGTLVTYTQQLSVPKSATTYAVPSTFEGQDPFLHVSWGSTDSYTASVIFGKAINLTKSAGETIKLFGGDFIIGPATATSLILFSSGAGRADLTTGAGATTDAGGNTIELVSVSSSTVGLLRVNGELKEMTEGNVYTVGSPRVNVYLKDFFLKSSTDSTGTAIAYIGADKITLTDGSAVNVRTGSNSDDLSGTSVAFTSGGTGKVSKIVVTVMPAQVEDSTGNTKDYTAVGGAFTDPVFKSFKWLFGGPAQSALSAGEKTSLTTSGDYLKISTPLRGGGTLSGFSLLYGEGTTTRAIANSNQVELVLKAGGTIEGTASTKDAFIVDADGKSHIFKVSSISASSSENTITLQDLGLGTSTGELSLSGSGSVKTGTLVVDGATYTLSVNTTAKTLTLSSNVNYVYTAAGAKITLTNTSAGVNKNKNVTITLTEGTPWNSWEETNAQNQASTRVVTATYNSANSQYDMRATTTGLKSTANSNQFYALSNYGTFWDAKTEPYDVSWYYPSTQVGTDLFVAPVAATTSSTTGSASGGVVVNAVGPVAKLDSEVASPLATNNLVVVGGPCVNTVAAALLGNPTTCTTGFTQGKAKIKLFENNGNVALLVAGYDAMDTRRAARVLTNYHDYTLSGSEVEVTGTSLTQLSVASVS